MKKIFTFLRAFSLVELMISLIIISLITAAFAPIITKKISAGILTVGVKGEKGDKGQDGNYSNCSSDITCAVGYYLDGTCKCQPCADPNCTVCSSENQCSICNSDYEPDGNGGCVSIACRDSEGLPTKGCCESVGAVYIPKEKTGSVDLCMMKYNAGDEKYDGYHPAYPKLGVQITTVESTCTKKGYCCWQGNTGTVGTINSQAYGAANRTVCEFEAAKIICNNWGYNNTKIGSWRLITQAEAKKLASEIVNDKNDENIANNLTKYKPIKNGNGTINDDGLQLCDNDSDNYGSNKCAGRSVCKGGDSGGDSSTLCAPYAVMSQEARVPLCLFSGKGTNCSWGGKHFGSVRCVTEKVENQIGAITNGEIQEYNNNEPRNQADCPDRTLFINKKYTGGVYNLCVMQYNAVDDAYPLDDGTYYHPDYEALGITLTTVGENGSCKDKTKCCWTGQTSKTSGTSTQLYDNYPSDKRAVCTLGAAEAICANWDYNLAKNNDSKKQKWRVMTVAEADAIGAYITADGKGNGVFSFLSKYLNSSGLQLCDDSSDAYGANLCASTTPCNGGDSSGGASTLCVPACVLTQTYNRPLGLFNGIASATVSGGGGRCGWGGGHYGSVRCVSNEVRNVSK